MEIDVSRDDGESIGQAEQAWQAEQARHKIPFTSDSEPRVPSLSFVIIALFIGLSLVGFGVIWFRETPKIIGSEFGPVFEFLFPMFGIIWVLSGVWTSVFSVIRYLRYRRASLVYQRRRAAAKGESDQTLSVP